MKRITFLETITSILFILFFIWLFVLSFLASRGCSEDIFRFTVAFNILISGLIFIVGALYMKKEFLKAEKIIFNIESLPILKTDNAVEGIPFVGEGIIESADKILISHYTKTPCVYFHAIKEKLIKENSQERWKIIENSASFVPFYIRDERGKLEIDIENFDEDFSSFGLPFRNYQSPDPKNSEIDCDVLLKAKPWDEMLNREKKTFFSSQRLIVR